MPRFQVSDRETVREIGRRLAEAVRDPAARKAFKQDPEAVLIAAGVNPAQLAAREIVVHEDSMVTLNVVIPNEINDGRVDDTDYLEDLGRSVLGACHRPAPIVDSASDNVRILRRAATPPNVPASRKA